MKNSRYILEPYTGISSRFDCPVCHKKKTFVRYVDLEKNEYLPIEFGKCNREVNCGYWLDPYKERVWEKDINEFKQEKIFPSRIQPQRRNSSPDYLPIQGLLASLQKFESNNFIQFLVSKFGEERAYLAAKNYFLGTSKHWNNIGATIFWQVDTFGNVRSGKIMAYDPKTGKRIKHPFNHITWVHKVLNLEEFNLSQCYFGEHLLKIHKKKPVALVESEKTAIISSFYFPQFVWIASGSLNNITLEKSESLIGRDLILFPDCSNDGRAFDVWINKAQELTEIVNSLEVSRVLEDLAIEDEKDKGYDLADYLLNFDPIDFISNEQPINQKQFQTFSKYLSQMRFENGILINGFDYPADWDTIASFKEIDYQTKTFIRLAQKNPAILDLQRRFDLE